jgi:flap endonuclease-1
VEPKIIELIKVLDSLSLTREQLIDVGILIGTDFNPDGVKGIGPKTAAKLIREHGNIENLKASDPKVPTPTDTDSIRRIFLDPAVTTSYALKWSPADEQKVVDFLCKERDFSEDRVRKAVSKMIVSKPSSARKSTLESYF